MADDNLKDRFFEFHEDHPGMPLREAAGYLEVSEAELLSSFQGDGATFLNSESFDQIPNYQNLRIEFRTDCGILEREVDQLQWNNEQKKFTHKDVMLQILTSRPIFSFLVNEAYEDGSEEQSLQYFNENGTAAFKVFLTSLSTPPHFSTSEFEPADAISLPINSNINPETKIDSKKWNQLFEKNSDLQSYYTLLENQQISPTQGLRLLSKEKARHVSPHVMTALCNEISQKKIKMTTWNLNETGFFQSTQIFDRYKKRGPWFILYSAKSILKLRYRNFGPAWIVERNINDQQKSCFEIFDKTGSMVMGFTNTESSSDLSWNALLETFPMI